MEKNFGCFYNSRSKICFKDPRSTTVENECQIVNNACRVKPTEPVPAPSYPTESPALVPSRSALEKELIETNIIWNQNPNGYISGPVTAYSTEYNGKRYLFFGDAHFSMENSCEMPCRDAMTQEFPDTNCWDITALLGSIFASSMDTGKYVDLYLEIPFVTKESEPFSREMVLQTVGKVGYMYKLYY